MAVPHEDLPHAQRRFQLHAPAHLGLSQAAIGEIDRDLGGGVAQPLGDEDRLDHVDVAVGANAIQAQALRDLVSRFETDTGGRSSTAGTRTEHDAAAV